MYSYLATAAFAGAIAFAGGWKVKTLKVNSDHKVAMEAAQAAHEKEVTRIN